MQKLLLLFLSISLFLNLGCVTDDGQFKNEKNFKPKSQVINSEYDGTYSFNVSCDWAGYGRSNINDGQRWIIKNGKLNHKKYRFNVKGQVEGKILQIRGTRQSGSSSGEWKALSMTVVFPKGSLSGNWGNGDCKGFLELKSPTAISANAKKFIINGSREYVRLSEAIGRTPVSKITTDLAIELQYPDTPQAKYPLVVIVPSSQGIDSRDEIKTARDFRKLGYATLLVYSYRSRSVGGESAEIGMTINSPTVALDALYALDAMRNIPKIDMSRTVLYGASKGSLSVEETMIVALGKGLPMFKVLLSENSNLCFDWSKHNLHKDVSLVVFTGGKDNSGTYSECIERTKIFRAKGYRITHIHYPNSAHRFIIDDPGGHGALPLTVDAYGYKNCEWLINEDGNQGYRNKTTGVVTFPRNRKELKDTIGGCLNRGIFYGGSKAERKRFFEDANKAINAAFRN